MLRAVRELAGVSVRSLYDLYPDFAIDEDVERETLGAADIVVWQHPFYWYGVPSLLSLWFEKVLAPGFAYGEGGDKLAGKQVLWVTTTGSPPSGYSETGMHGHPFEQFVPSIEQTARFCGMRWEPPIIVHGAHRMNDEELEEQGARYRARLSALIAEET